MKNHHITTPVPDNVAVTSPDIAKKKLFIQTYGCQMNVYDSVKIGDLMHPLGYTLTEQMAEADMVVLNTCNIREKAAEKVYSELGRIRPLKVEKEKAGSKMLIVVAGCVGQAEGEEVFRRAPFVDIVVGPQSFSDLPELTARALGGKRRNLNLSFPKEEKFDLLPESTLSQGVSAFLTIQEGCDKFCHFCVVPYTRGAEFSRPVEAIYREAHALVAQGAKEITLLGQNVNAYHGVGPEGSEWDMGRLLIKLAQIDGIERLRYTTSHPMDMHDSLYEAHATLPKLMPFLHLPVQSGSDAILKAMNRKHTAKQYLEVISKLKQARPDIAFSSDFIVGYPGETEQDFLDTMALVREVGFAGAYSFKYSPRPGTPATLREQVDEAVKDERLAQLQALLWRQQIAFNRQSVGTVTEVLFDGRGKIPGQLMGRTPHMQSFYLQGDASLFGTIQKVRIEAGHQNSVSGSLVMPLLQAS